MNAVRFQKLSRRLGNAFILLCLLIINTNPVSTVQADPGGTIRVSVASDSTQGNGLSADPSISADGHYVTFKSAASNLVNGDTNGAVDVFVHNRQTGHTARVSVASDGTQGNSLSDYPSISADGRYVTFDSEANNLVSGDTNFHRDVFVHDRQSGQTTRVSVSSSGTQGNNSSGFPSISADGRYVAFSSDASNLVAGDTNGARDIFVHDLQSGQSARVSISSSGTQGNNDSGDPSISVFNGQPSISADGRYITFWSHASNLVTEDTNGFADIFVHDKHSRETTRVSIASDGTQANSHSDLPRISADGRYVAFSSKASNLVSEDTNGYIDIFVHDRQSGETTRVSVASDGTQGNSVWGPGDPSISADGRYVAFYAGASNLVSGDTNDYIDIFIHDRQSGQTTRVSVSSNGTQGNNESFGPSISADGSYVAFYSQASNLVSGDTNAVFDVFVHENDVSTAGFTISGNAGVADATVSYTDGTPKAVTSAADGGYSFTVRSGWSGTVTPSKAGYTFFPQNRFYSNVQADQPNQNYTPTPLKPLVIIVHGVQIFSPPGYKCSDNITPYDGTNSTLGSLPEWFHQAGHEVWIAHYTTSPDFTAPLESNALCLRDQVKAVAGQNSQPIMIVAHSMGGVVSRAAIRYLDPISQKRVFALYTLGSPHAGLNFQDVIAFLSLRFAPRFAQELCTIQLGECQLSTTTMLAFNAMNPNLPGVKYTFIGGDATPGIRGSLIKITSGPNDGAVGEYSSIGWAYKSTLFLPWWWVDQSIPTQYWTHEAHATGLGGDSDTNNYLSGASGNPGNHSDAFECITALMNGFEPEPQYCKPPDPAAMSLKTQSESINSANTAPAYSAYTELKTGHLEDSQSISVPLQIDTNTVSLFYLTWNGDTPTFTLTRPDAQVIDPAYLISNPSVGSYETALGGAETPPYAAYEFPLSQPGIWQLNITATGAVDYQGFAALESSRTLKAQSDKDIYPIGNTATITANLDSSGTGLSGATVTATLTRPDIVVDTVSLTDQGNGTYANTYSIPDAPGYLTIDVTATGNDSGTAFSRQENLLVAIAPNDLQLTGSYSDQPRDDNSDGFYDYLDFTAEANLVTAGEYAVSAGLYAGDQLITQSGDFFTLNAGVQTITLPFDGGAIYESGLNGPYTIKNLHLTPIDIGITAASVENVWTTSAYSYTQFADTRGPEVSSITRADANPTNSASVRFIVSFSEIVTGVDVSDFLLNTTGLSGAEISSVAGTGAVYTVSVNTGTGNGTIQLHVPLLATIQDLAGNPLETPPFTDGEVYSLLKTATFDDVPADYWAWSFIERLYAAGITGGCGLNPLRYCPEDSVTRAQMAVFLERGIHGASYNPPPAGSSTGFDDVSPDYWSAAWIKQLAADGITGGCGLSTYCPEAPVTRAQMAVFLLRSKYGAAYTPPSVGSSTGFMDVPPTYWAAAWIKQLVAEGITSGCGASTYCPEAPVTRAQMAVFLVRTFSLP